MKKFLSILALAFLTNLQAQDSLKYIGKIYANNALGWDASTSTGVMGYHVYLSETNELNFKFVASVIGTQWAGSAASNWFGFKAVAVTAFSANDESVFSELALVEFNAGIPISPPSKLAIFQLLILSATNSLPLLSK